MLQRNCKARQRRLGRKDKVQTLTVKKRKTNRGVALGKKKNTVACLQFSNTAAVPAYGLRDPLFLGRPKGGSAAFLVQNRFSLTNQL